MCRVLLGALLAVGLCPCFLEGQGASLAPLSDWPQWRGPYRDGISREKGLLSSWPAMGPRLVWTSKAVNGGRGLGTGYSSVSVANGRIYTMGDRGKESQVICLDETSGRELWVTPIAPAQGDGPRCTPTVDGDRVYALSRQGELACLGADKGEVRWRKSYKKDFGGKMMSHWDYSESPLVDGEKLVCTPGGDDAAMVALNKHTGALLWKAAIPDIRGAGYSSIVIADVAGVRQYLTLFGRCLAAVDAKDGRFLWRYNKIANGTANIPTPIVQGDLVFTSTGYQTGCALLQLTKTANGVEAKEIYFKRGRELQNHHGGTVLVDGYIYGGHGHNDGQPFCLEMTSGKLAWGPMNGPGQGSAAVVYADGKLYFRYQNSVMALVQATPKGYNVVSQFRLPDTSNPGRRWNSWPHPVVVHGKLFIRGQDSLLCYDVKQN